MSSTKKRKLSVAVGDKVDALWPADGEYYPAKVRAINDDGTIALDYADGDRRNDATTSELRRKRQATPAEADPDFAPAAPPTADAPAARSTVGVHAATTAAGGVASCSTAAGR